MTSHKLKLGFIGAGWWAAEYQMPWFAARADVNLVAVCRLGKAELAYVQGKFGFAFASEDYRDLLAQDLDAVVVASPHALHHEHTLAALHGGKHVMVEKPMTVRAAHAREIRDLARANGLHVLVPQGWNFTRYVREARALVNNPTLTPSPKSEGVGIGEPRHIVCQMASALGDLMAGQPMIETAGQHFRPPASTWADPHTGGYGYGQLAHALGVMFALADVQPIDVSAFMGASPSGADYYDAITVRFANGATAAISGSATIPKSAGNDRSKGYQIDLRIFGSDGMLLLDVERERCEIRRVDGNHTSIEMKPGDGDYPAAAPWETFVDLVLGRTHENPMDATLGTKTIEVLEAAYRSASEGGRVVSIGEL